MNHGHVITSLDQAVTPQHRAPPVAEAVDSFGADTSAVDTSAAAMGPRMAPVGSIAAAAVAGIAGTAHSAQGVGAWAGTTHSPSCTRWRGQSV